ncbi:MAG: 50S ribosomal protein L6 [Alphaproteobacteria bacterium]|nr:50S ribosomal protein L6 [Alphaproteobacteria bacterium]
MSRLAKIALTITPPVEVKVDGRTLTIKGPKGTLMRELRNEIDAVYANGALSFVKKSNTKLTEKLWGTYASHARNMLKGVTEGFKTVLIIEGVGFKSELKGNVILMRLGFSHPVEVPVPKEITASVKDNHITLESYDKELLGNFAAKIRAIKKPEPYKGKGIRYSTEVIRRKQGKKATT